MVIYSLSLLHVCFMSHISKSGQDVLWITCVVFIFPNLTQSCSSSWISYYLIFNSCLCKGHVKKSFLCVWSKCTRIPDNTEYVTWQFLCLNLMWCQAGWNRSILGKHWTIHLDKPVLLFNSKNTCKTGLLENANLIKSISLVKIRSGFPEKRQKLTNMITLPSVLSFLLCFNTRCC